MDVDAMSLVEGDGLVESGQDTGDFFIGKKGGKSDSRMVIDGDVERFGAGAWVAVGAIAGGTDAGLMETAKLFNIQMKEFAGSGAFVTPDRRFGGFERTQAVEAVALEDAGKGSF